jgi:hypothetical protein
MLAILILGVLAVIGIAAARLLARALEAEHLLAMRDATRWTLFERDGDRRYHHLPLAGVPAALCRFACGVPAPVRVRGDA